MPTRTHFVCSGATSDLAASPTLVVIGRKGALASEHTQAIVPVEAGTWAALLERTEPGETSASTTTWVGDREVVVVVLPEACSRHMSPSRAWAIPALAKRSGKSDVGVLLALTEPGHTSASVVAVAKAFPLYDARSGEQHERTVTVVTLRPDGSTTDDPRHQHVADGVRLAARLVDAPASELHTTAFVTEAEAVAAATGAELTVIRGDALRDGGFGGLWGVGKAATHGPALVVLTHRPEGATREVCWVGKGIVYDTGGLSLKGKDHMPGMKGDMGGAAAVLGAFQAAALGGVTYAITAILCLAENSVGPDATRPDDVLHMYSGKTVEVNNTDAEGRLVLADGVAWACRHRSPNLVVDVATLTGAALMTGGKVHACVYTNSERCEYAAVAAGRRSGEVVHPLLFAPELHRQQFRSPVADMKKSVKDRMNAQCSCAAWFVGAHLPEDPPAWVHVDIAGPSWDANDRGTGFGVGLLIELASGPV